LKENLPACFKDKNFTNTLDEASKKCIQFLNKNLNAVVVPSRNDNNYSNNFENFYLQQNINDQYYKNYYEIGLKSKYKDNLP
jgi:protein involved in sex pheromone biosynthesis